MSYLKKEDNQSLIIEEYLKILKKHVVIKINCKNGNEFNIKLIYEFLELDWRT